MLGNLADFDLRGVTKVKIWATDVLLTMVKTVASSKGSVKNKRKSPCRGRGWIRKRTFCLGFSTREKNRSGRLERKVAIGGRLLFQREQTRERH